MMVIKKYGNRRLYDTEDSRYVTLDEVAAKIREGADARVVDAKTGEDLTQATLTQMIVESRGAAKLLPIPVLHQLVRLGDDALAEFMGRYVAAALEMYLQARSGAQAFAPYNPFASMMSFGNPYATAASPAPARGEMEALRREMDELKRSLRKRRK